MTTMERIAAALGGGERGYAALGAFLFIAAIMLLAVFL